MIVKFHIIHIANTSFPDLKPIARIIVAIWFTVFCWTKPPIATVQRFVTCFWHSIVTVHGNVPVITFDWSIDTRHSHVKIVVAEPFFEGYPMCSGSWNKDLKIIIFARIGILERTTVFAGITTIQRCTCHDFFFLKNNVKCQSF